jgi:lipoprotein-releasing system permease protein
VIVRTIVASALALLWVVAIGVDTILGVNARRAPTTMGELLTGSEKVLGIGLRFETVLSAAFAALGLVMLISAASMARGRRGRARLGLLGLTSTAAAVTRFVSASLLDRAVEQTLEARISFEFGASALFFTLDESQVAWLRVMIVSRGVTDLLGLVLLVGVWKLIPDRGRRGVWAALDAALALVFVAVSTTWLTWLFPLSAISGLEITPDDGDPASLGRASLRLAVTSAFVLRLAARLLVPALKVLERTRVEVLIASRHLRSKKSGFLAATSFLSILAVAVACAMLTTVLGVMGGFRQDLKNKILGQKAHILVDYESGAFEVPPSLRDSIARLPGVTAVTPYVEAEVMVTTANGSEGAILHGIHPDDVERGTNLAETLVDGSLEYLRRPERLLEIDDFDEGNDLGSLFDLEPSGSDDVESLKRALEPSFQVEREKVVLPPVILGRELARAMRLYVGDELEVVSPHGRIGPTGRLPKTRRFRVAGIFYSGMYEYDMKVIFMPIDDAARFLGIGDAVNGVEIRTEDPDLAPKLTSAITQIGKEHGLRVRDWQDLNRNLFGALALERLAMFFTLGLAILIAGFSVFGTFILLVEEKAGEIAILRTVGASTRVVLHAFVFEGFLIGMLGSLLGLGLGYLLTFAAERFRIGIPSEIFYIDHLPIHVEASDFVFVGLASVLVCVAATIFPATMAAKLRPVDSLRHE